MVLQPPHADLPPAALAERASWVRRGALTAIYHAGSGHPGGSLSAADVLTVLFHNVLRGARDHPDRDRFVLSKGHSCPALYAVAAEIGLIPRDMLKTFRRLGSPLQGHPHVEFAPWVDASTGSLGQGFSQAVGMALGLKHRKSPSQVYVMLGDGELQEGEVWEGAMCAAHYKLANLCAIVDYNKLQSDDLNENIMGLAPLADKWAAFNWHVQTIDGHDIAAILAAFQAAQDVQDRPSVIIADTVKGHGVSFMAGDPSWHGSVRIRDEELSSALTELGADERDIDGALQP